MQHVRFDRAALLQLLQSLCFKLGIPNGGGISFEKRYVDGAPVCEFLPPLKSRTKSVSATAGCCKVGAGSSAAWKCNRILRLPAM
jgi:hypothetical protein